MFSRARQGEMNEQSTPVYFFSALVLFIYCDCFDLNFCLLHIDDVDIANKNHISSTSTQWLNALRMHYIRASLNVHNNFSTSQAVVPLLNLLLTTLYILLFNIIKWHCTSVRCMLLLFLFSLNFYFRRFSC